MLVRPRSRCGWGYMWAPLAVNLEYIAASILDVVDEVRIVNQEFDRTPIEEHLRDFGPDLFGVTMSATDHVSGLDLCRTAKKHGCTTMVGGYHPTAIPGEMMSNKQVDMLFKGESEFTAREYFEKGSPEGVEGIWYRKKGRIVANPDRPVVMDLDTLPFPARHLRAGDECSMWTRKGERHRDQIHTSRGCWGRCTFCCEPSMSGSRQRFRRPEKIMEEVVLVHRMHHEEPTVIIWGDPHFMGKPSMVDELSDLLIEEDRDIIFTAMLRSDAVAKHPDIVAKMVKAGIVGYCMGIETPAQDGLNSTKKGITNQIQRNAVSTLRRNHAVAGGTFVIGLPGQTREEILMFPEFARNLGMINAAFAIATPQAATEFYRELDDQGLITDHDWTRYDQMHLVFRHERLTDRELEELLTGCLGRFYALDIFLDDMISYQYRQNGGAMMSVKGAIEHFMERVDFIMNAGDDYQPEEGAYFGRVFLEAQVNPWTKKRTRQIGIHNVVDMERMLRILGDQKLQITLKQGGEPFARYVVRTDAEKVHYLDITKKDHKDATVKITLNLEELRLVHEGRTVKFGARMLKRLIRDSKLSSLVKGGIAVLSELVSGGSSERGRGYGCSRTGKRIKLPDGFQEDLAVADGWDPERYAEIKRRNGNG